MIWPVKSARLLEPGLSSLGAGLLALLCAGLALAQGSFGQVGAEIDGDGGYLLFGAVGGPVSDRTTWDLAASRADAATKLSDLRTTAFDGSLYPDFGDVGLRVGLGSWRGEDLVRANDLSAALDLHGAMWTLGLETQWRQSDFEPVAIDRTVTLRNGSLFTIQGGADCEIDDTALGARLSVSAEDWYFSVSGMRYDYESFGCEFSVPAVDVLRRATRARNRFFSASRCSSRPCTTSPKPMSMSGRFLRDCSAYRC